MAREPELFIAPCSQKYKDQAYKNFEDTVLSGVSADEYGIDIETETGRVPVWGVVSGNESIWERLEPGDIVLFYTMGGVYTDAGRVHSTEQNAKLGDRLWKTYDGRRLVRDLDEPWPFLIYFYDVMRVDIPVEDLHPLLGWKADYPQRFTRPADQDGIREAFGSVPGFVRLHAHDTNPSERDAVERRKQELLEAVSSPPALTADTVDWSAADRVIREQGFRDAILELYDERCAVCGANRYAPNGTPAVEAAHIYPKSERGADDVRNGLALCKTHHWAFDVGWFGLRDDDTLVVRNRENVPGYEEFKRFSKRRIHVPESENHRPHEIFKRAHRELHGLGG